MSQVGGQMHYLVMELVLFRKNLIKANKLQEYQGNGLKTLQWHF